MNAAVACWVAVALSRHWKKHWDVIYRKNAGKVENLSVFCFYEENSVTNNTAGCAVLKYHEPAGRNLLRRFFLQPREADSKHYLGKGCNKNNAYNTRR